MSSEEREEIQEISQEEKQEISQAIDKALEEEQEEIQEVAKEEEQEKEQEREQEQEISQEEQEKEKELVITNYTSEEINYKVKKSLESESFIDQVRTTLLCVYELANLFKELSIEYEEIESKRADFKTHCDQLHSKIQADLEEVKENILKDNITVRAEIYKFVKAIAKVQDEFMVNYEKFEAFASNLNIDELKKLLVSLETKQNELLRLEATLDNQKIALQAKIDQANELFQKLDQIQAKSK